MCVEKVRLNDLWEMRMPKASSLYSISFGALCVTFDFNLSSFSGLGIAKGGRIPGGLYLEVASAAAAPLVVVVALPPPVAVGSENLRPFIKSWRSLSLCSTSLSPLTIPPLLRGGHKSVHAVLANGHTGKNFHRFFRARLNESIGRPSREALSRYEISQEMGPFRAKRIPGWIKKPPQADTLVFSLPP